LRNVEEDIRATLIKRFTDNLQSDEGIVNRLSENLDDVTLTRYIAFKLNEKLSGENGVLKFDPKLIHVEHIAPDSMTNEWREALGILLTEPEEIAAEYEDLTERIGNKTLLEWRINSQLKNKEFGVKKIGFNIGKRKIQGYKDSSVQITKDLLGVEVWSKEFIEKRSLWFAEMFNIVWGFPTSKKVSSFTTWLKR
jgi:hypothetical protein